MEKDKAVKLLCEKGLHAYNDHGIVMIALKDSTHSESSIKQLLKEIGYDSSFGIIGKGIANSNIREKMNFPEEKSFQTFADDNEQLTFQW